MKIIKEKTVAVTGHRMVKKNLNLIYLTYVFKELIEKGYDTFLTGMALGFDSICFDILYDLKKQYDIKLISVLPCKNQAEYWEEENKEFYKTRLSRADEIICLNEVYYDGCMFERNRYLVDKSNLIVAYYYKNKGGTHYTVNYARSKKKEIIFVK